jgi:hypothetical protein
MARSLVEGLGELTWAGCVVKAVTGKVPDETIATGLAELFEEEQITTVADVIADGEISADKLHVTDLAFAGISENTVIAGSVSIPVLFTRFPREEKNQRSRFRRRDTALPLATIDVVDITDAIVDPAGLESRHAGELLVRTSYVEAELSKPASSTSSPPLNASAVSAPWPGRYWCATPARALLS